MDIDRPADVERLPARFKKYISALETLVAAYERDRPAIGETTVKIYNPTIEHLNAAGHKIPLYLREGSTIAWRLFDDQWVHVKRQEDPVHGAHLEVACHGTLGVVVYPGVSNVVHVGLNEWHDRPRRERARQTK